MAPAQPRYVNAGSFLNIARQVFDMMDTDLNGSLDRDEILDGVKNNKKVKHFLKNCGHEDLQYLMEPDRLEVSLKAIDEDGDGQVGLMEWEHAIRRALNRKLRAAEKRREELRRKKIEKAPLKELREFLIRMNDRFKERCKAEGTVSTLRGNWERMFNEIDDDGSGTLSIDELAEGLQHVGISITAKSLRDMMASLGLTTRSTILYKDFLKLFLGQFKPASQEDLEKKALAEAQDMLIRKLSKNESGSVNEDSLMKAFQAFDDNGDGWIDSDELQRGFLSFGLGDLYDLNSPMAPFKRLVDSCDDNGDGKINYK